MGQDLVFLHGPLDLLHNLDKAFTFLLLVLRFSGMILVIPGIGAQAKGIAIRYPFILMLAFASMFSSPVIPIPKDVGLMVGAMASEVLLGLAVGMIPFICVGIVQSAGQLASTSMGLQAGALIDPSTGGQASDISRLFGDFFTLAFLSVGGHRLVIYTLSGMNGRIVPGSFVLGENTLTILIQRSSDVFGIGMLLAAPVIVALLLTQFMMGLIAKAVPTVNVFIVSFPLTIGIGFVLTILMLPEFLHAIEPLLTSLETSISAVMTDLTLL